MQTSRIKDWCAAVDAELASAEAVPVNSDDLTESAQPLITLAGAYNSGKTSLVKRLLFDAGLPVPADLAVGADPTTFEPRIELAGSLALRDTPGLGSGQALHNQRAVDACADTDALVLVVTPQLLAAADDEAWALLTGDAWGGEGPDLAPWRAVVINRFDTAGADPTEDLAAYHELAHRKTRELLASLQSRHVKTSDIAVFVTASDPFALVDDRQPEDGDYTIGQGWDGMPALAPWLHDLPSTLRLLRAQRAVRVRLRALGAEQQALSRALPEVSLERSAAEQNVHQCRSFTREFNRLRDQLRADLDEALESALGWDAQDAAAPDRDVVVRERLSKAIQRWIQAHADRLSSLAAQAPTTLVLADIPSPTPVFDMEEVKAGPSHLAGVLQRLRDNRDLLRDTASAFEKLAGEVPKLRPAQTWLKGEAVTAAISAVDLLWKLGNHDEAQSIEAARLRQSYLKAATEAADKAAAPFAEWMDQLADGLQTLLAQARAEVEAASTAEHGLQAAQDRLQRLVADRPTLA